MNDNHNFANLLESWMSKNGWIKFISLYSLSGKKWASFPPKKDLKNGEFAFFILDMVNSIQANQFFVQNGGLQEMHMDIRHSRMYIRIIEDKAILVVSMAKDIKMGVMTHDLRSIVNQLTSILKESV